MAIRIPILTSFDPKGLRQANASFAKLQGSVGSLGRNFAVAGAAIAAAGAVIAKNVQSLARIERINAQTAQTITSMGNASNISAKEVESLAGSLEALTATEAETIQEGANLLLTFRNIANQAGAGNDIFTQTTAIMVDMGRALNEGASASAIRLGKALNDPIRGITALRKVGVGFTEDQEAQIKALQESGDLMGAQKVILAELQAQFGGSGAAYAKTFSGQLELMGHELGTIGEEATMSVMPALQGVVEQLRELIPVIGPQLKAAIESVDFEALAKSVVDLTTFLITNADAIVKTLGALFLLSTAYKTMAVAAGIAKVATDLYKWSVAQATAGTKLATTATTIFSTALRLIPIVAIISGLALLVTAFTNTSEWAGKSASGVATFAGKLEYAGGKAAVLKTQLDNIPKEVTTTYTFKTQTAGQVASSFGGTAFDAQTQMFKATQISPIPTPKTTGGGSSTSSPLQQIIADSKQNAKVIQKQSVLERKGLSAEVAAWVTSSNKPVKAANEAIARISKNGNKAIGNLTKAYTNSAAGQAAAAAAAASEITESFTVAYDDTADKEAAALAERERVFKSFADSVKATFAGMKTGIINAFDLTELGGSSNAITRNMEKLLVRLRAFADNVKNLASMGLNPALLQQVISAGPMGGARLAEALVMGGAGGLSALNAGYSEFGALSSQIAQTGTESLFNQAGQQSIYNINVDGGVGSGSTIGKAIVDAIKAYERTSGAVWQGA
jgi:hypothetical protein